MATIHPTAVIAPGAELDSTVEVGPYCVIGPHVKIGAGTRLIAHACVDGHTAMGRDCTVFPFTNIGGQTQDLKFAGGCPRVEIGDHCTFRECVTVNAATFDGGVTQVGSNCHIMAYAHVAHDCLVGNGVIIANAVALAGHVTIHDEASIGGLSGVHQFVRLGRLSFIGGCAKAVQDLPPFMLADGNPLTVHGLNVVGMERRGITKEAIALLKKAYRILYRENLTVKQAVEKITAELELIPEIELLTDFVSQSERGITR